MIRFNQRMDENYVRYPDLKILYDENTPEGFTYGQMNECSGKVYHFLKRNQIGKEDFVLIRLPRSIQSAVAMFGVMKAGAAFVLGEEGMPLERLEYIRRDCNCKLEIHAGNWEEIMKEPFLAGHENPDVHDAAFAIYTSGTTGNPKGVLHEYGNIDRDLTAQRAVDAPFAEGKESVAVITPLYFIAAVSQFISRLYSGYVTYILPYSTIKNSAALKNFFEEKQITSAFLSPSYVRAFGKELTSVLKTLSVGSEPVNNLFMEGLTMVNTYSMSECGFLICMFPIDKPYDNCPIGRPLFDLKLKLVDENGFEVADGEAGELCVEDPYVRGYINLPEQTAKVFVDGFFHTGDIARKDENGNYVILGRNNDMMKINGNRVEPAEIEAAVRDVTGLSFVAAKGFVEDGHAYICAYYTEDVEIDAGKIKKALADRLPYYMIPAYFVRLDEVPLNQNGKLDRRKLVSPDIAAFQSEYVAPSTETEKILCSAMEKILKSGQVGVNDDFFIKVGSSEFIRGTESILIDLSSWHKESLSKRIERIQNAIEEGKIIRFHYYAPKGDSIREIEPYYLIFKWSSWYVWGWCRHREDYRMFKLMRMDRVEVTNEQARERKVPLPDLSNERLFPGGIHVKAVFQPEMKWHLMEEFGADSFQVQPDGTLYFEHEYTDRDQLIRWMLTCKDQVTVLEPEDIREEIFHIADNIRKKYEV